MSSPQHSKGQQGSRQQTIMRFTLFWYDVIESHYRSNVYAPQSRP